MFLKWNEELMNASTDPPCRTLRGGPRASRSKGLRKANHRKCTNDLGMLSLVDLPMGMQEEDLEWMDGEEGIV